LTNYVCTRWFRAPELLLRYRETNYTNKIDMWSAGCVLAEMNIKRVLFGEKDLSRQIQRMISLLGKLPPHLMAEISDPKIREFLSVAGEKTHRVEWGKLFPDLEEDGLDLLSKLLEFDPEKRISAEKALQHPFFADLYQADDLDKHSSLSYFDFEFEMYSLDTKILRDLLMDEILIYNNPKAKKQY
jgi:serine/threonine protein kinase